MAGSIRKRGKTWEYSFELGKINGKRKRESAGGFLTKKEAEKALRDALSGFENGETFWKRWYPGSSSKWKIHRNLYYGEKGS